MNPRTYATYKYNEKTYDQLSIRIPKGLRALYKKQASERGLSLAALITRSIDEYVTNHPVVANCKDIIKNEFHSSAK